MRSEPPVVVLGAGPAGLGAAHHLARAGLPVLLVEKAPVVGGMGASVQRGAYQADYGPHTFHLKDTAVTALFDRLVGADCNRVCRNAKLWLHGRTLPFPLRAADVVTKLSPLLVARIAADYAWERTVGAWTRPRGWQPGTFEDWGRCQFGWTLYRLAFGHYTEKMWGRRGSELSDKLARQKLNGISLKELILSALGVLNARQAELLGLSREARYDAYPGRGIGTFFEAMAREITAAGGRIVLETRPVEMEVKGGRVAGVRLADGERTACRALISTIPLPALGPLLPASASTARAAAARVSYRSLCCVHLVLNQDRFSNAHWIYMLDERLLGNRLSEQKNLSPRSCPAGQTVVCMDITCDPGDYLWKSDDSFLIGLAMSDLKTMGLHPRSIVDAFVLRAENVYPIYALGFERDVAAVVEQGRALGNLFSVGRHGLLLNNDMHDSIEMGMLAAQLLERGEASSAWYDLAVRYVRERLEGRVRDPIRFEPGAGR